MMQTSRKVRRFTAAIAATTLVLGFLPLFSGNQHASAADGQTLFTNQTPTTVNNTDGTNVNYELGMRFQPAVNGQITAIRFWKSSKETGTHTGRIWNASGTQLASVVFSGETASGWQEQALATPLSVSANAEYTVSVNTGKTYYADTVNGLASKITNGDLSSVAGDNGRFGSPGTYPTTSWQNSNYFRDVRFAAAAAAAPAINSFSISPQSLTAGQSATLSWSVTGAPAPSISIDNGIGAVTGSSIAVTPSTTTTYTLTAANSAGTATAQATVTVNPVPDQAPAIISFTASPASVAEGGSAVLSWSVSGNPVPNLSIDNGIGAVTGSSITVTPATTTTYTLTAANAAGTTTAQTAVTVTVPPPPDTQAPTVPANLSATAVSSSRINLSWSNSSDNVGVAGYKVYRDGLQIATTTTTAYSDTGLSANTSYSYTVSAYDAAGNNSAQASSAAAMTQEQSLPPVIGSFLAAPSGIAAGSSTTLSWSVTGAPAPSISIDNGIGAVTGSSIAVSPATTTTYTLTATNSAGIATAQVTVAVATSGFLFDDEFNGTAVDTDAWVIMNRHGDYSNNEIQCYTPNNVQVAGGTLIQTFKAESVNCGDSMHAPSHWNYTSSMVQWKTFNFLYGTVEVRAKLANLSTWPAVWLLGHNCQASNVNSADNVSPCNWPQPGSEEIDMVEFYPNDYSDRENVFLGSNSFVCGHHNNVNDETAWHTYTMTWAPGRITWYIDGVQDCTETSLVPSQPMFLMINIAANNVATPSNLPTTNVIDYLRVTPYGTPSDTTAPSTPANLSATAVSSSQINLSWSASTDNVGVTGYRIYRNGTQIATTANTSYSDSGLSASTSYTYRVSSYDAAGNNSAQSSSASATTQAAVMAPAIISFTASPASVAEGGSAVLSWSVSGNPVPNLSIDNGIGAVTGSSITVTPATTTTYTLTAANAAGTTTAQTAVTVTVSQSTAPAINSFSISPQSLTAGQSATLSWSVTGAPAPSISIDNGIGAVTGSSIAVTPSTTTTYTLTAANSAGTATAQATITVNPVSPSMLDIDVNVSKDQSNGTSIKSPTFSTAASSELLLAFIGTGSSGSGMKVSSMSGAGLSWSLVKRTNTRNGTAEIWKAFAANKLTNVSVTASLPQSVASSLTIVSFTGSDPAAPLGATGTGNGASGAQSASLTTTKDNSWVFGVGNDWDGSAARTVGPNQTMVHQYLGSVTGDTVWVQRQNDPAPASGTTVTISDTAPTNHRWNLSIVEVLPK